MSRPKLKKVNRDIFRYRASDGSYWTICSYKWSYTDFYHGKGPKCSVDDAGKIEWFGIEEKAIPLTDVTKWPIRGKTPKEVGEKIERQL